MQEFLDYVSNKDASDQDLAELLTRGEMEGYYKISFFWSLYEELFTVYPEYISTKQTIGQTFLKKDIHSFYIGEDTSKLSQLQILSQYNLTESAHDKKNMILFTAAHHAREALSLSMIFNIFLINLKSLVHKTPRNS